MVGSGELSTGDCRSPATVHVLSKHKVLVPHRTLPLLKTLRCLLELQRVPIVSRLFLHFQAPSKDASTDKAHNTSVYTPVLQGTGAKINCVNKVLLSPPQAPFLPLCLMSANTDICKTQGPGQVQQSPVPVLPRHARVLYTMELGRGGGVLTGHIFLE